MKMQEKNIIYLTWNEIEFIYAGRTYIKNYLYDDWNYSCTSIE